MNQKAIEIQIYFEIAMAIGTSLDLQEMLKKALSAYLRKLSCATGAILQLEETDGYYQYAPSYCIPRNTLQNPVYRSIFGQLPKKFDQKELYGFIHSLPLQGTVNEKLHFHIMELPDFGALLLVKNGQALDLKVVNSLRQLNRKLADSCRSCLQNNTISIINKELSEEVEQRKRAETQLKFFLDDLEQQVMERTSALQESEQRYRAIFDNIQDIFFSLSLDGRINEISPSIETTLNYSRSHLLGRSLTSLGFSRNETSTFINQIKRTGSLKDFAFTIRANNRLRHHFSINATLTGGDGDHPLQIIGSLRDITQQYQAEQAKKKLEEQLHNSKKMEALGLLAGGVAHDLNNVLSGIVSYPDLLLTMIDKESHLAVPLKTIRDSGRKAAAIVQDLLTMARRGVIQKDIINLNRIITEYLTSPEFEKLQENHGKISIDTDLQDELLNLAGSPLHIKNALMNLVLNSVEAAANHIVITTENIYFEDSVIDLKIPEGDYVSLKVTDNGSGISKEDQQRVFEPFYTKKVMGKSGTGLGMSVVWGTIQDHNGHIVIESEPGGNTTFQLIFPGSREDYTKHEIGEGIAEYQGKGESVLVVDDCENQRKIAMAILQALNYTVQTAASGEEAIQILQTTSQSPDIILLDMIMERGMDGLATFESILQHFPDQKVILVSGYSETKRVQEALRLGALLYIRKPYLMNTISSALRQCLPN
ncbi:PAS domain-containing sensor histidine kinase [Desulfopila sp. IMCC35008]|uniref:hybrid sensor histidine kinase/response regulator n=1 Tax=Desulfopila sp. IMCC35008 TaxID=2653858 RepID=UPI0013D4B835|nr:PAS domain-containing sensor histidine kinase [Desulfopila sp. IMCC35008]